MFRSVTMAAIACVAALVLAATPASAGAKSKGTKSHAIAGTLEKVDGQTLTIKTSTQTESVMLGPSTHITEHGKAIQASQLSAAQDPTYRSITPNRTVRNRRRRSR